MPTSSPTLLSSDLLSTEVAIRFYDKWYAPNNAVLIVVGDVDPQRVRALAEKYYGVIPTKDIPERQRVAEPPQNASREVRLVSPRVAQPQVRSEEHTSELQSLMRTSYAVFCL